MKNVTDSVKQFLQEEYAFRRNLLSGKIEYRALADADFRPLALEDMNSICMVAEAVLPGVRGMHKVLNTVICSRLTPDYDPAREWLLALPAWDGLNHVGALLDRLPGLQAEHRYWLSVWLRSVVAHWLQMDQLHGNEVVPTLIGAQGCGKSTFSRLLLPEPLREYYLDHVNLGNKFDKEMALTNNLLVNIDELDQVRRSQQAGLKQLLSKSRVNGRPIYGRTQADRQRYASFVATMNNHHPLHDPTGSRRFLCIEIPADRIIDNRPSICYDQLYAQLLAELKAGQRYWFDEDEVRSMQRANTPYQSTIDLERIVDACFCRPAPDAPCEPMTMSAILDHVAKQYPFVQPTHSMKVQFGMALGACGYQHTRDAQARRYYVALREA